MDLDGDGKLDIFSGSYPGHLYLFRGQKDGSFAASVRVEDARGEEINVGQAAAAFAGDWDVDGDMDLLIGDIRGHVWFLQNESGTEALELGEARQLEIDGEPIRVPGGDAGPVLSDWDSNGTLDLLVGCGDGSVRFYANANEKGTPALVAYRDLMPKSPGMSITAGAAKRCGTRVKLCVTDYNSDGLMDLLVGDVLMERVPPPEMTDDETEEKERAQRQVAWIQKRYGPAMLRVQKATLRTLGIEVGETIGREVWDGLTEEQRERFSQAYQHALQRDVEAAALSRMMRESWKTVRRFQGENQIHGHVWVRLRQVG